MRWRKLSRVLLIFAGVAVGCQAPTEHTTVDYYATELFHEVQMAAIFPDSKTFADCVPNEPIEEILRKYDIEKMEPGFDLKTFVEQNFQLPDRPVSGFQSENNVGVEEHIKRLWPVLTRTADNYNAHSSLLPLPTDYVVPGGRFSEIYYWDSYFTMLGLKAHGRTDLIADMIDNFAFLIDSIGHIPNGNRNYYVTRSQPPFFSLMVKLLDATDSTALPRYLKSMQKEYDFWMQGSENLVNPGDAEARVVMLTNGTIVNRYWDNNPIPRPEAHKEDFHLRMETGRTEEDIYRDLKAGAESGWDFSSRWFDEGRGLGSIHTTDIVPIDLNALMYFMERTLAEGYGRGGNADLVSQYSKMADDRRRAILTFMWDPEKKFFMDYDFVKGERTGVLSLAGMYPFFFQIPSHDLAVAAAGTLQDQFLKPGGFVTTLSQSGQQWDAPNGWAPLQWICYAALKNYGINDLAATGRARWLRLNEKVFQATGKMMEKYNVIDTTLVAGGGEYPNQDGFGWTNGVWVGLKYDTLSPFRR
ncbi:MAG: alpha,alpha-trehalase TreF [Cyclobacteriaceae bacterium]